MQVMKGKQWEECFGEILFPLLQKLLENLSPMDPIGMEETRVRVIQLISKILLNHLTPLNLLPSFRSLWLRLLDYMNQYLHADRSELLSESIPESLKNMILVVDNTDYRYDAAGVTNVNDETQFATSSMELYRVAPPHLLYAQQQLQQPPIMDSQSSQISYQLTSNPVPMMMSIGEPLFPSPNSAFSPPVSYAEEEQNMVVTSKMA
ncbi:hypothetical protein QQG55_1600 [Brugia pahangi]